MTSLDSGVKSNSMLWRIKPINSNRQDLLSMLRAILVQANKVGLENATLRTDD